MAFLRSYFQGAGNTAERDYMPNWPAPRCRTRRAYRA